MSTLWLWLVALLRAAAAGDGAGCPQMGGTHAGKPLVLYNRIPKCGSTTMINLLRSHQKLPSRPFQVFSSRHFHLHDPFQAGTSSSEGWAELVSVVGAAAPRAPRLEAPPPASRAALEPRGRRRGAAGAAAPTIYINHVWWPNLTAHDLPRPAGSFQLMREPVARAVSTFYFLLWGPRQEESMTRSRHSFMKQTGLDHPPTINEYVASAWLQHGQQFGCGKTGQAHTDRHGAHNNMMTRYFCGFHADCADICRPEALARAKAVLRREYQLVGLLEEFDATLELLEKVGPEWFAGIRTTYASLKARGSAQQRTGEHNGTSHFEPPTSETQGHLREWNVQDTKLYAYAKELFAERRRDCGV